MDVERKRNVAVYVRVARVRDVGRDTEAQRRDIERYCRENNLVVAATLRTTRLTVDRSSREMLRARAQFALDASMEQGSDRADRDAL
ncbi:hypothetical protein [Microbacterium sp. 10M-3C3]|uniref:hypothetical protein n=1 Tax=Microbacterium sp. 10M-3C3 TaxID=2483401 RepID=UPI0013DE3C04|nr:hypothetical protein [Microbacterium sp. 10M-3C3]